MIDIEIDRFTPCLIEKKSGKIVPTDYEKVPNENLESIKAAGWNFCWSAEDLQHSEIYKLIIKDDSEPQGLLAIKDFKKDRAVYIQLAESAPHNIGAKKRYEGVGGHLFAIAAKESVDRGYGGFLFLDAKNEELVSYYQRAFGAYLIGGVHQYRMLIDEVAAHKLLSIYTFIDEE